MTRDRTPTWMGIAGITLVIGFFMPWIDLAGLVQASGWDLVREGNLTMGTRVVLALCPIAGLSLALAAFARSRSAGLISLASGAGVLGYTFFKIAYTFTKVTGWGLWLVLAAGAVALVTGLAARGRQP